MEMSDVRGRQATFDDTVTKMQGKIRICRGDMGTRCLFSALVVIMMAASLLVACSGRTSYYATFSRRVKHLDFTFEYPREWWVTPVERYSEAVAVTFLGPDTSDREASVTVMVSVWLGLGPGAEEYAQRMVDDQVSLHKDERNFLLLSQGTINLDAANGYQAEYKADFLNIDLAPSARFYIPSRTLNIAIPRNGTVYNVWIHASQNEWNAREKDIQHILDTFRWK